MFERNPGMFEHPSMFEAIPDIVEEVKGVYIYIYILIDCLVQFCIQVVPHKVVAEVLKIGSL